MDSLEKPFQSFQTHHRACIPICHFLHATEHHLRLDCEELLENTALQSPALPHMEASLAFLDKQASIHSTIHGLHVQLRVHQLAVELSIFSVLISGEEALQHVQLLSQKDLFRHCLRSIQHMMISSWAA